MVVTDEHTSIDVKVINKPRKAKYGFSVFGATHYQTNLILSYFTEQLGERGVTGWIVKMSRGGTVTHFGVYSNDDNLAARLAVMLKLSGEVKTYKRKKKK